MESFFKKTGLYFFLIVTLTWLAPGICLAHFGVLLPSDDIVEGNESRQITLSCQFMHPFEQGFMELEKPMNFAMFVTGKNKDLLNSLKKQPVDGCTTWVGTADLERPGDHIFYFVPQPYWEPAEDCYIQHFTKVVVNAFGLEEGWDQPVGLKTEIIPLTRPYGLWTGNIFVGQVLVDGKPAPDSEIEIEFYNKDKKVEAPADPYITQVVHTDSQGIFSYVMPKEGWWGFAALNEASEKMKHEGREVAVELGAVLWLYVADMR
ncbi:MAG: DUF4198 domain-containing protein [Deltaproteobacteria bacterium]|nr:MAG: DUF4198 domain-containing protein [Deltaproteobacteria bacterium]